MSSDRVLDYLTEELVVEKNIVTYRSLSNALGIHVNEAKNELAFYYSEHVGSLDAARATYLISGEPRVTYLDSVRDTEEMAVDDDDETVERSEDVSETKITLVGEAELESSKEQYARIDFIHIYGLSPSPIREPALLCEPAKAHREAGTGKNDGAGSSVALGRITGPHVKKRTNILPMRPSANVKSSAAASTSKSSKLPGLSKAGSTTTDTKPVVKSEPKDIKLGVKQEPQKPKPSGKLDFFSKAKPAAPKTKPEVCKTEPAAEPSSVSEVAPKSEPKTSKPKDKPPVRRKSTMTFSDSEDEASTKPVTRPQEQPPKRSEPKSTVRVKKGVILSDDEEEEAPKPARPKAAYKAKTKTRYPELDAGVGSELQAMMDIDDDQVTRVSRTITASESATSPPVSDVDMEDRESAPAPASEPEPEPALAPTRKPKRKPKKQVPVGRNGLKKRRVVKSRMTTDDKGYFVTEDYSSYESVDEEEPPAEKPAKRKGKKVIASAASKSDDETAVVEKPTKKKGKKAIAPAASKSDDEAAEDEKPAKRKGKNAIAPAASKDGDEAAEEKVAKPPAKKAPALERKPSKPNAQKGGIASYFTKK